jgi:putative transposase
VLSAMVRLVGAMITRVVERVAGSVRVATRPAPLVVGLLRDLPRSRDQLIAENALLRQQLIVAARSTKRPRLATRDRVFLVLLARPVPRWRDAILLVKPETVLRWHREGFKLLWRWKTRPKLVKPKVATDTVALIRGIAVDNRLWGAESIRGELMKLGIRLAKRTVQRYIRAVRRHPPRGQTWATFLSNHRHQTWACDFLQIYDLWFRPIFAFFIIELGSRRLVHVAVTREPTSAWVTQQLRNRNALRPRPALRHPRSRRQVRAGVRPSSRPGGSKSSQNARASAESECRVRALSGKRAPRLRGSYLLVLGERHLLAVLAVYGRYFNEARPHQGLHQAHSRSDKFHSEPHRPSSPSPSSTASSMIIGELRDSFGWPKEPKHHTRTTIRRKEARWRGARRRTLDAIGRLRPSTPTPWAFRKAPGRLAKGHSLHHASPVAVGLLNDTANGAEDGA